MEKHETLDKQPVNGQYIDKQLAFYTSSEI